MFYANCPLAFKFKYQDKIPELPRPAPKKKGEHANDRGSRIHQAADDYINSVRDDLIPELQRYAQDFKEVRQLKTDQPDMVHTEQRWKFDPEWLPDNNEDYELIVIIDIFVFSPGKKHARVIDIKSGKRYNNEVKHAQQTQLYQLTSFRKFPELENITAELWYVDQKHGPNITDFTAQQGLRFITSWQRRVSTMANDTKLKARPHETACKFCVYGKKEHSNDWVNKTGDCQLSMDRRDRA